MRLNRQNISKLELPAGKSEVIVFDDDMPGFGVRIRAGGKRTWIVQYRMGRQQRRVSLGSVSVLDPDKAREQAKIALSKVNLGNDPQMEKAEQKERASITFASTVETYLVRYAAPRLRPKSYTDTKRYLQVHWKPLNSYSLHGLTRPVIAARMLEISNDSGETAANRARAALSSFFSWAMGEGLAESNPVIGTNKAREEVSRDHVIAAKELAAIWEACRDDDYGRIVRLLILTGQRREEVGGMAASEIHEAEKLWMIPKARSKNGLPHDVPLSDSAIEILVSAPRREGRPLIFGEGEGGFQGWSKAKAALDERIRKTGHNVRPWRLHDIRRTVATGMAGLGVLPHVVEAVLNHISGYKAGVAGVYNRATYANEKRKALEAWALFVGKMTSDTKGGDHE